MLGDEARKLLAADDARGVNASGLQKVAQTARWRTWLGRRWQRRCRYGGGGGGGGALQLGDRWGGKWPRVIVTQHRGRCRRGTRSHLDHATQERAPRAAALCPSVRHVRLLVLNLLFPLCHRLVALVALLPLGARREETAQQVALASDVHKVLARRAAGAHLCQLDQLPALTGLIARADERVEVPVLGLLVDGHRVVAVPRPARPRRRPRGAAPVGEPRLLAVKLEELLLRVALPIGVLALVGVGVPQRCVSLCALLLLLLLLAVLTHLDLGRAASALDLHARALRRLLLAWLDGRGDARREARHAVLNGLGDKLAARRRKEARDLKPAAAHDGC